VRAWNARTSTAPAIRTPSPRIRLAVDARDSYEQRAFQPAVRRFLVTRDGESLLSPLHQRRTWNDRNDCVCRRAILILTQGGPASAAPPSSLQSAFASAASKFGVPQNVLLAVSYVSAAGNDTQPSAQAGTGRCSS